MSSATARRAFDGALGRLCDIDLRGLFRLDLLGGLVLPKSLAGGLPDHASTGESGKFDLRNQFGL